LYYSYALLAPAIAADVGIGLGNVALAFSATLLVAGLLAPVVGRWLDGYGAVAVLRWACLVGPVSLFLLATARTPLGVGIAFLLLGVAQALSLYEPAFRAAVDWFRNARQRARALLLITSVGGFASTVFLPVTAALVRGYGWRMATLILAVVLAIVMVPVALVVSHLAPVFVPTLRNAAPHHPEPLRYRRWLGGAFAAHAFASATVAVALVWLLVDRGQTLATAAMVTGLAGAAQVPGRLLFAPLHDRLATGPRVTGNLIMQAIALAALAVGPVRMLVPAVLVFGALSGMLTLERAVIVAEWFGDQRFGAASGSLARSALVARASAPAVVAGIANVWSHTVVFVCVAATVAAGALAFALAVFERRRPHVGHRIAYPGVVPVGTDTGTNCDH
jgi:MFS family permease